MPKHRFTKEEQQKGGKIRSSQDSFKEQCSKGFRALEEKQPAVARAILKHHYGHVGWPDRRDDVQPKQ